MTRRQWANSLLQVLDAPQTKRNRMFLVAWMQTEGYGGKNNPLNTTLWMPGSTVFNSHGVRNYVHPEDGVIAAAKTLLNSDDEYGYARIIKRLRRNDAPEFTAKALLASSWGTTDLVLRVLADTRRTWPVLAQLPASA